MLVLCLISPLNDILVVLAAMVLKFEKIYFDCKYINKEFIQTFKLLVFCLISLLKGLIVVWAAVVLKFEKKLKPMNFSLEPKITKCGDLLKLLL